jgi:nitrite reductase/ring-hydroxylating ferredoxin subunit
MTPVAMHTAGEGTGGYETMQRRLACHVSEMPPGSTRTIPGDVPVALYRTEQGEFFATADRCTHEEWSLGGDSDLEGEEIICPLHMARYDIRTGKALCFPATLDLQTFAVEIEGDDVFIVG